MAVACPGEEDVIDSGETDREPLPWFALQVRTRQEIGIADCLASKGYERLLPLYTSRRRWSDRIKELEVPLFPGYVFCRFDPQNRLAVLKTPGVVRVVGNGRSPVRVCDHEINSLRALIASGLPKCPCPFLQAGDRVRIEVGPLRGSEGLLVRFKGNYRLVLSVTLLQRAVAVEIDSSFVLPLRQTWTPPPGSHKPKLQPQPVAG
jgi:transcription antitermination factor NusG